MADTRIEDQAAALLRAERPPAAPLSSLYRTLAPRIGAGLGGPAHLRERLRNGSDRMIVIDPPAPSWTTDAWTPDLRRRYGAALARAGLAAEPRVVLLDPPPGPEPPHPADAVLSRLAGAIAALSRLDRDDPTLASELTEAVGQLDALRGALRTGSADHAEPASGPGVSSALHQASSRSSI